MTCLFATLFITAGIVHLCGCAVENGKLCDFTKPALMPLLACTAASALIPYLPASSRTLACIATALAFGTAGDVLLLSTERHHFIAGTLSFLAGHLFWIAQYARQLAGTSILCGIIAAVCYTALLTAAYVIIGRPGGIMGAGSMIYGAVLCLLNFTGIAAVYAENASAPAVLFLAGSVLFLASDSMLGYSVMKRPFRCSHFLVMLTYIAAQSLLAAGTVLPYTA